ncbi:MAG: hypothetical protein AB8B56_05365 [Crocinitomicaceae bacterium]
METEAEKKLSDLLQRKSFSELTMEERTFVLSIISEEKFESYRILLGQEEMSLGLSVGELTIKPEVKDTVLAAFKAKHKKEKKSLFFIGDFFTKSPMLIRAPVAIAVLALIGILIVNLNQNNEQLVVEDPVLSDVMELNEDDSLKTIELEPSLPEDPTEIANNEVRPEQTSKSERKERVHPKTIRNNPEIAQVSIASNHSEINQEEMEKYMRYSQAGMNEKLIIPEMVEFQDGGDLVMPETYENPGQ